MSPIFPGGTTATVTDLLVVPFATAEFVAVYVNDVFAGEYGSVFKGRGLEFAEVREYLLRVAEYWVERGIDGWRLDVPEEIQEEGFWEEFRARVRAKNPDAYIVGEIWGDASDWTRGDRFDGTMNYLFTGAAFRYVAGHRIVDDVVDVRRILRQLRQVRLPQ